MKNQKISDSIPLRPYQLRQMSDVDNALACGIKKLIIQAPCGAGKTMVSGYLTNKFSMPHTIMQVHRDELVHQTERTIRQTNPDLSIGVVKAERNELDSDFIIVSAQTLARESRLKQLVDSIKGKSVLFLDDECHHSPSTTRRRTIETIDPDILIGLTATAYRADKKKLTDIFQEISSVTTAMELISDGWLVDASGIRIDTDIDLDKISKTAGDFNNGQLSDVMDTPYLNTYVVENWEKYAQDRKKTVVFCVNKKHANNLCREFIRRGHKAECVIDSTKTEERQKIYHDFQHSDLSVIVNVMVISEGVDLPCIDCIVWCRPTQSLCLYVQGTGRGMRLFLGKDNLFVMDFVGNSSNYNLITLPTWAGVEAMGEESLDHEATIVKENIRKPGQSVSLHSIVNDIRGAKTKKITQFDVLSGGGFKWNAVDGHWMVNTGSEYITIVQSDDGYIPYKIYQEIDGKRKTWKSEPLFSRGLSIDIAIGVAETKMKINPLTDRLAQWRYTDDPATDAQINYAHILGINIPDNITKGQLADMIDKSAFAATMRRLTF